MINPGTQYRLLDRVLPAGINSMRKVWRSYSQKLKTWVRTKAADFLITKCLGEFMRSLKKKISSKRKNAEKEGLCFSLTEGEVRQLLLEASITEAEWTHSKYHLARFEDKGDYVFGNCRFIPATENYKEKKISQKSREASKRNVWIAMNSPNRMENLRKALSSSPNMGGQNKLTESDLADIAKAIKQVDIDLWGGITKAAKVLGVSPRHAGRLIKRCKSSGLL